MNKRKIIPYNPRLKALARDLRNNSTKAEIFLWLKLKNKQMHGYDFHRQKPIDNYILDFFCHELMLGIEIDGYSHELEEVHLKDKKKTRRMNELGIEVLRFTDRQVFRDMFNVLLAVEDYIRRYEERHAPNFSQEENENEYGIRVAKLKHTPNPSQEGNKPDFEGTTKHNSQLERTSIQNSPLETRIERSRNRGNTPNSPLETCAEPCRSKPVPISREGWGCVIKDDQPSINTCFR